MLQVLELVPLIHIFAFICFQHIFRFFIGACSIKYCNSPEILRKLYLSTKFPHQEIKWNFGILRSGELSNSEVKFHVFQPISGMVQCRSSRPEVFFKKSISKNLAKFTGKHLCWPEACNFIKKETLSQVFSREFCEIFKSTFFKEHLWTTASEHWSDMGKVS